MNLEEQTDKLKELYSSETSEVVQPNFNDVKINAENIEEIKILALALVNNVFQTINDNIDSININTINILNINTLASMESDLQSLVTDKPKLDSIFTNLGKISIVNANILDIQNADENAQLATSKAQESSSSADLALEYKNQAQSIVGGTVFANNIEFADLTKLDAYRTSIDNAIQAINTLLNSDDVTLDELQEIVNYIKQNKSDLQNLNLSNIAETATLKNFTSTLLTKLNGISENANNFSLSSGSNIKTINNSSIVGSGNLTIEGVPSGVITMWSGLVSAVPSGWFLCDGANGTPDLRDTFVFGASVDADVGVTGGSADAVVVEHGHTGSTNTTGNHSHSNGAYSLGKGGNTDSATGSGVTTTGIAGNHSHTLTIDNAGEDGTNKNLPPYIKLAYIMKG